MERRPVEISQQALERQQQICAQIRTAWEQTGRVPRAFVDTYGCQQNEADSERIRGMLRACGYDGYLTAEMNGFPCQTDAVIYRTLDALKRIINS